MKRLYCVVTSNGKIICPNFYEMADELEHDGRYFRNREDAEKLMEYDNDTYGPGSRVVDGPDIRYGV